MVDSPWQLVFETLAEAKQLIEAWQLRAQPMPDPASRVTLLHRSLAIFSQNPVDERRRIHQLF
jgi:hypothetical protein